MNGQTEQTANGVEAQAIVDRSFSGPISGEGLQAAKDTCRKLVEVALVKRQQIMLNLLNEIGVKSSCRGCSVDIWFIQRSGGKATPYTAAGTNHFIDCPHAARFRKGDPKP